MTDRKLLERAAKAAGIELLDWRDSWGDYRHDPLPGPAWRTKGYELWNPLTDDGDALRLAVKLRIDLSLWINTGSVTAKTHIGAGRGIPLHGDYQIPKNDHAEPYGSDPYAATRRAIVRAAAAMAGD